MRSARALALIVALPLFGCSAVSPFATFPDQPKPGVVDVRLRVAVCFNALKTSDAEIQEVAKAACPGDMDVEKLGTDYRLDFCPVSAPGRTTFACMPKKKQSQRRDTAPDGAT